MGCPELITVFVSKRCTPLSLSMQIVASSGKSNQLVADQRLGKNSVPRVMLPSLRQYREYANFASPPFGIIFEKYAPSAVDADKEYYVNLFSFVVPVNNTLSDFVCGVEFLYTVTGVKKHASFLQNLSNVVLTYPELKFSSLDLSNAAYGFCCVNGNFVPVKLNSCVGTIQFQYGYLCPKNSEFEVIIRNTKVK